MNLNLSDRLCSPLGIRSFRSKIKASPNWGMAKGVDIGRSFILIPTPWVLMPHPNWPIFSSAFVEKTTNANDGYTVSEANIVKRSVALLLPTVLFYFLSLYPLMADAFLRHFSHRREKRVSGGG